MVLKKLSRGYLTEKDPDAPLFYKEEGNKKFQGKDYMGATVLYSKVRHSQLRWRGSSNNLTKHISSKDRAWMLSCVASGSFVYILWIGFEKEKWQNSAVGYILQQRVVCIICPEFHQETSIPIFFQIPCSNSIASLTLRCSCCQLSLNCVPFLSKWLMRY